MPKSFNPEMYGKVDDLPPFTAQYSHVRGYGAIRSYTVQQKNVSVAVQPFNRLQPLTMPFGTHLPQNASPEYIAANPQTTIAWLH